MQNIELCEWQRRSPKNGMIQCWFTHLCLDWIEEQDWSDKTIIMFGAGLGDAWLADRCKKLYIVERNKDWLEKSKIVSNDAGSKNIEYILRPCNDSDGKAEYYLELPKGVDFDVIINDDAYRTELCQVAVDYFKSKKGGGILVADNFDQDFVWRSPKAIEIMKLFFGEVFYQVDHTNHEGNQWNTRYWIIK